ncbi:MAG: cytochrome c biogenesis protein CcdA [Rhodobacteraceae bacterium]|nr:cytochrome c biogenesis protein CcdA [Paracoccaceae bacterium]
MFGIDLFDASLLPAILIALSAGVLSFLSPCVLPIIPPYLAYMGGISMGQLTGGAPERRPAVVASVFFVLGLSTVFLLLGFAASTFGRIFLQYQQVLGQIAGVIIIVFGLHFLNVFRIPLLMREARLDAGDRGGSAFGAYVLGLAFAFGWTPCIGPILGAILSMGMQTGSVTRGTMLLGVYAIGLGLPFILSALFISRAMGVMNQMKRHMGLVEKIMGGLLVLVGVLMLTGGFSRMSYWLLENLPMLGNIG